MPLRPLSDVSPADWFVDSDAPWHVKVGLGPPGFEAYARVFYDLDEDAPADTDERLRSDLRDVLAGHTTTPGDCFFALWDGTAVSLRGGRQDIGLRWFVPKGAAPADIREAKRLTAAAKLVDYAAAFAQSFLYGPKVAVPNRDYYLFAGSLFEPLDWGAADYAPGVPRDLPSDPALMWPADHACFAASDVNADWLGVGGTQALIDELLADRRFDAIATGYGPEQPGYR